MKIKFIFLYLFVLLLFSGISQQNKTDSLYIQFSGIVVTQDSLKPLPYCTVIDKSTRRGTITDFFGYFSFVAKANDVIKFSSVGYKNAEFIIPDTLTTNKYSLIQIMFEDTIMLKTATIYPWPSKEQFAKAFVETKIPNDDYQRALANLSRSQLQDRMEFTPMDGAQNFKWQQQQIQTKLYYAGQYPPNQLFNPVAWIKFIEAWKRGDFKKK